MDQVRLQDLFSPVVRNIVPLAFLEASIKRRGYDQKQPLVVHKLFNGKHKILCGTRRYCAVCAIADEDSGEFKRLFPDGTLPALVYEGLSDTLEVEVAAFHDTTQIYEKLDI